MFRNVSFQFSNPAGKTVYVPSEKGRAVGRQIRQLLSRYPWDTHYRHLRRGGPVAILHEHRDNAFFATLDVEGFFGSIRRNVVAAALKEAGVDRYAQFAKWATVRASEGGYVLGYGLPASTHLATLVMQQSPLGAFLRAAAQALTVQVYVDDISLSGPDRGELEDVYELMLRAVAESGFGMNGRKSAAPASAVRLFNCDLAPGRAVVSEKRRAAFYAVERTGRSADRFERYCRTVEAGNVALVERCTQS